MEFTFTISDGRARQQYGFVKQLFVASTDEEPSTHVVPMYVWFTWILRLVHARLLHDPSRGSAVELLNAIRKAGTTDHSDFTFRLALDHGASPALYTFPLHPPGAFGMRTMEPHILNNRSFTNKLQSPTVLLVLLSALLHEQKVLLVHDERDVLRGTCQLLLRLLAPFTWKHLLIPVLPEELLHYAHAPIPYLMGVTTDAYSKASSITNAIVFNLHEERIELRNLTDGFPTLCCDACPIIPHASTATVPFAKLSTRHTSPNSNHSAVDTFRHDLQHCFMNTPGIVDNAAMLLDFMASPHRWFAMRASRSQELWLSTVVFPRLDIRPMAKGVPSFAALHHTIGRFHQPVHSVNLLDLDYGVPPSSSSSGVKMAAVNDDPFDTNAAFPTHWG
ncbi:hypothetical protein DYB37_002048 [Aphanomyces astaci]|uniref:UDENN domain-containing protein n=1 Tax=Aphanomyces astaci TaxID=112090 RepID=A0A3R7F1R1_APHAT|nr:hypothetical protein DYB35_004305 [Aphanomyces astaci]RHZ21666.1 hypothetical protein DYB37_002048 [Aphanomyces astaci]